MMPQLDIFTFFIQTAWLTLFFIAFYFSYIKFILNPLFKALNTRTKIYKMTSDLNSKIKKRALTNLIYAEILKS